MFTGHRHVHIHQRSGVLSRDSPPSSVRNAFVTLTGLRGGLGGPVVRYPRRRQLRNALLHCLTSRRSKWRFSERLGRRAVLTSAGQALRTRLETLMREADSVPHLIRDPAEGVHGDVRIGATSTAANAILPSLLGGYRRAVLRLLLDKKPAIFV